MFLPHELTWGVLARIPVKKLVVTKCVCKEWNDIISYPKFPKDHERLSPAIENIMILNEIAGITTILDPNQILNDANHHEVISVPFQVAH